jgi:hypothetical protein
VIYGISCLCSLSYLMWRCHLSTTTVYMVGYLIKYGKPRLFAFHWTAEEFAGASLQFFNAWTTNDLMTRPFHSSIYVSTHTLKNIYNQLFVDYIHLKLNKCYFRANLDGRPIMWCGSPMDLTSLIMVGTTSCANSSIFPKIKLVRNLNIMWLAWLLRCFANLHWSWPIVHFIHLIRLMWNTPKCGHKWLSLALQSNHLLQLPQTTSYRY